MSNTQPGLLGRKIGMTQIYKEDGTVLGVTAIEVPANAVLQVKTEETADGYNGIQLGIGERKIQRTTRAARGHAEKAGHTAKRFIREFRLSSEDMGLYADKNEVVIADIFTADTTVDVTGRSKGRGFAGVVKRHNFSGVQTLSHGTHEYMRHGGSIGCRLTPGRVIKGKKMPGHMGNERVTIQNLQLVHIDTDHNLMFVRGGVPGPNGGLVMIRQAVKA